MKVLINFLIFVVLALPVTVEADPFWCDGGPDRVPNYPLSFEKLSPELAAIPSEVGKISMVQAKLNEQVSLLSPHPDGESLAVFNNMVDAVLDVGGPRFLSTAMFRSAGLFGFGVAETGCDPILTASKVNSDRPMLYAIYEAAEAVELIGNQSSLTNQKIIADEISASYSAYDAWLLTNGLPQWPWELWLNGKALNKDIRKPPPLRQWIFARPSAGIDLSYASQEDADAVPSFGVEMLGIIKYRDRSYKKYIGASLLATVGTEDGAGYGVALRWNGYWAGYVFKEGDRADAVYIGIDLYKVLQDDSKRKELAEDFADEFVPMFNDLASRQN